jgi:Kef-type K+ transport system membrane component KefB
VQDTQPILQELWTYAQSVLEATPPILLLGLALVFGALAGELMHRLRLPRLTGYFIAGVACHLLLSLLDLGWPVAELVLDGRAFFQVLLGFVLVEIGRRIQLGWLLRNRALFATSVLECAFTFGAVYGVLSWLGVELWATLLIAAIATGSSPVVIHALATQTQAEGQISERALHLSAVSTMVAAVGVSTLLTLVQSTRADMALIDLYGPALSLIAAIVIGGIAGRMLGALLSRGAAAREAQKAGSWAYGWQCLVGVVLAAIGLAQWLNAPVLVATLVLGLTVAERPSQAALRAAAPRWLQRFWPDRVPVVQQPAAALLASHITPSPPVHWPDTHAIVALFNAGLFMFAAAALPWSEWAAGDQDWPVLLGVALGVIAVRLAAKAAAVSIAGPASGTRWSQHIGLAVALQPMSITGLAMYFQVKLGYAAIDAAAMMGLLLALAITDVIAPLALLVVLKLSGESPRNPSRRSGGQPDWAMTQPAPASRIEPVSGEGAAGTTAQQGPPSAQQAMLSHH